MGAVAGAGGGATSAFIDSAGGQVRENIQANGFDFSEWEMDWGQVLRDTAIGAAAGAVGGAATGGLLGAGGGANVVRILGTGLAGSMVGGGTGGFLNALANGTDPVEGTLRGMATGGVAGLAATGAFAAGRPAYQAWQAGRAGNSAPRPVPQGHTRVYRAVSEAEYQDILRTGRFNPAPNTFEGRWFADSLEGAQAHGRGLYPQGNFRIVEADVPNNAPSLYQQPNLDRRGPARFLHLDDLRNVRPRPVGE